MKATLTQLGTATKRSRALALCASTIMALTLWAGFPPQASAATGVSYIDTDGELRTTPDGVDVTEITDQGDFSELGEEKETTWYVVYGDFTINHMISLEGEVHLILADGCNLETKTIHMHRRMEFPDDYVYTPTNFTIYGQSAGTGTLTATGNSGYSGIGGWNLPELLGIATITIAGGRVTAIGGDGAQFGSAGIGGVENGCGNIVTITGGIVTAIGGNGGSLGGSGIGNGGGAGKTGGSLTVTGGIVTAIGKNNGSGIGGNVRNPYGDNIPIPITITGGIVTATGGDEGSGIGSSQSEFLEITVSGGTLIATGAAYSTTYGIGSEATFKTLDITNAIVFANTTNATTGETGRKNAILVTDDETRFYDSDVSGTVTLSGEYTIPEGKTINIPAGKTLIIEAGTVFYNAGTITGDGTLINKGTIYNTGTISSGFSGTGAITVTIPIITTTSLKAGEYNSAYSQTLSADGNGEIKWEIAEGTLPKGLTLNPTTGIISGIPTQAGTYDFTVKATNIAGSDTQELSLTINQIAQSALTITNLNSTYTYGDTPFNIGTTGGTGEGAVTYTSSNKQVATASANQITIHKAGTFKITATKAADDTYKEASIQSGNITVDPKPVTISGVTAESKEYDGELTAKITGDHAIEGKLQADDLTIVSTSATATFDNKNVANDITVTFDGFSLDGTAVNNYELSAQPTSAKANITQKPVTITGITAKHKVYDGNETAEISGNPVIQGNIDQLTVNQTSATAIFDNKNVADGINVTFDGFALEGDAKNNYTLYQPAQILANITAKPLTFAGTVTATKKYDGDADFGAEQISIQNGGNFGSDIVDNDEVLLDKTGVAGKLASANAGTNGDLALTGDFTLSGADAKNYALSAQPTVAASITQATPQDIVWPTAKPITYGIKLSAVELDGGDGDGDFAWTAPDTIPTVANKEYEVTFAPSDADNYDYSGAPGWDGSTQTIRQPVSIMVNAATLTVTPNGGQTKVYGEDDPLPFTFAVSGWQHNDQGDSASIITGALIRDAGNDVGEYGIKQGRLSAGSNYDVSFTEGVMFEITKATLTVTPTVGQTKVYGEDDPLPFTFAVSGWQYLDQDDSATIITGVLIRDVGNDVGEYGIKQGRLSAGSNYDVNFIEDVTFEITKATLTVTPTVGQTKVYGDNDPLPFTFTVSGWLYRDKGDSASIITGALSREEGDSVRTYAITQGDFLAGSNYDVNLTDDVTFEITPAVLTVTPNGGQAKVYGEADPTFTFTTDGWLYCDQGDSASIITGALSRDAGDNVRTYAITQGDLSAGKNYDINFTDDVTFEITPATLTVTPNSRQTKVYGEADPTAFTFTTAGWKNREDETLLTGALNRNVGNDVGTYAITQGDLLETSGNYNINFAADATFAITKATPTAEHLTFDLTDVDYNGAAHPVAVTQGRSYDGMGDITVKYNDNTTVPVNADDYAVTVEIADGDNFNATTVDLSLGNFTINKIDPTAEHLTFDLICLDYNGAAHPVAVTPERSYDGMGDITVKYNDNTTVPVNADDYAVTVEIADGDNFNATTVDLSLGNFTINKIDPTLAHLYFDLSAVSYDGTAHPVAVMQGRSYAGMGAITVKYDGDTTAPVNANTCAVMVAIADGDNFNAIADLSLGNFTIAPSRQEIRFAPAESLLVESGFYLLSATVSASGGAPALPPLFRSSNEAVAEVSGDTLWLKQLGTVTVTAYVVSNGNYESAAEVSRDVALLTERLDFDTYVAVKLRCIMIYNNRLLGEHGYAVGAFRWYGNGELLATGSTYALDAAWMAFSPDVVYHFEIDLPDGRTIRSTDKRFDFSTDVAGVEESNQLLLYPNPLPSGATLNVRTGAWGAGERELLIYSAAGNLVLRQRFSGAFITLPFAAPAGVYFLRVGGMSGKIAVE